MKTNSEFNHDLLFEICGCRNTFNISDMLQSRNAYPGYSSNVQQPETYSRTKAFRPFSWFGNNSENVNQPVIESILDTSTCRSDGSITPGRNLQIKGSNIRICSKNNDCGIFLTHCTSGKAYKIPRTDIVLNDPSMLLIFVPENMEKGEYILKISTTYNGLQKELKQCRTTVFEKKLVI